MTVSDSQWSRQAPRMFGRGFLAQLLKKNDFKHVLGVQDPHQSTPCKNSLINMGSKSVLDGFLKIVD